jgi:hypothetical protein
VASIPQAIIWPILAASLWRLNRRGDDLESFRVGRLSD